MRHAGARRDLRTVPSKRLRYGQDSPFYSDDDPTADEIAQIGIAVDAEVIADRNSPATRYTTVRYKSAVNVLFCTVALALCVVSALMAWRTVDRHYARWASIKRAIRTADESGVTLNWRRERGSMPLSMIGLKDWDWIYNQEVSGIDWQSNPDQKPVPRSLFVDLNPFVDVAEIAWAYDENAAELTEVIRRQRQLRKLQLYEIRLTERALDLPQIFRKLEHLEIDFNFYDREVGSFLRSAVGAPYLETLILMNANLSDEAYVSIPKLRALRSLTITHCNLSSEDAAAFVALSNLEALSIEDTFVDDQLGMTARHLKNLRYLNVSGTQMTAKGLCLLRNCPALRVLWTGQKLGTPELLAALSTFPMLESTDIAWGKDMLCADFKGFRQVTALHVLRFKEDCIDDHGLMEIAQCAHVVSLEIESDRISMQGIKAILGMPKLRELKIEGGTWGPELVELAGRSKSLQTLQAPGIRWLCPARLARLQEQREQARRNRAACP